LEEQTSPGDLYLYVRGTRGTPPPITAEITEARASLARVVSTDLPALEDAIDERDFDAALERASRVRGARTLIRGLLAGGDAVGLLRADWMKVETRIDAALVQSPRPNADRESARTQWTARLARGTGSPGAPRPSTPPRTAAASASRPAARPASPPPAPPAAPTAVHPRGKRNSSRGRPRSTSAGMAAAANSIGVETYYPPSSGGAGASAAAGKVGGGAGDFADEPPTKRVRKRA